MVSQFQELFVYDCLLQVYLGRWYLFITLEKLVFAFLFTNPLFKIKTSRASGRYENPRAQYGQSQSE